MVHVVFVNAHDGTAFARSEMPAEQLPETFQVDTTVQLGDTTWSVERAEPPTAAQFRVTGLVTLTVRRVELVPARNILYSLPTICDTLPAVDPSLAAGGRLELHDDDWRQVELVHADLGGVVDTHDLMLVDWCRLKVSYHREA